MATLKVVLTDHQALFLDKLVESGRYPNISEVLREGLRLIEQREAEDAVRLVALRGAVSVGVADIEQGRFTSFDIATALGGHLDALASKVVDGA